MRARCLPLIVALASVTCDSSDGGRVGMRFADTDPNLVAARDSARASIAGLRRRLEAPPPSQSFISAKVPIHGNGTSEHFWLDSIRLEGDSIRGRLRTNGTDVQARAGDWVAVPVSELSDWMAIDSLGLCGGYSVRLMRNRLAPARRGMFDSGLAVLGLHEWRVREGC